MPISDAEYQENKREEAERARMSGNSLHTDRPLAGERIVPLNQAGTLYSEEGAYQVGVGSGAQDSGQRTQFDSGALRDRPPGKGRFVLLSPLALRRIAIRCEEGERKYGDGRNWEKGMPVSEFIDSAMRHMAQYMTGDGSEDHLAAAAWNLQAAMATEEMHPDMQDIPTRKQKYPWFSRYSTGWDKI